MNTEPSTPENDGNLSALGRELLGTSGSKPSGPWVPPTAEELHKLLPEYEIVKMLGRGGMGAVYMGRQNSLDRPVAIKILSTTLEDADPSFTERFKNEAKAMGKLSHPGIVAVYDFGEAPGGLLYIVMEYVDGTDVAKMIAKAGRLHTEHAMAITAYVCDALAYAHDRGIIHRDIKPANIMVGYDGVVKVADFGLAKMTQSQNTGLTQSGMAMGTLHYMAPEALMLGSGVDHRADIYAVGVMLYQMLTGKIPQGMFELPSLRVKGLDPRYDAIIAKALREDREQRYQSVGEMRADLDGILTRPVVKVEEKAEPPPPALPTQARPQRPGGQPYRPPQSVSHAPMPKSSSGWLVSAVLGLLALGCGYFWLKSQSSKSGTTTEMAATSSRPTPPNPFEAVDSPEQPMPAALAESSETVKSAAFTVVAPSPTVVIPSPPAFDLQQLPDFRTRIANYQKARHAKLNDLTTRYRTALTAAKSTAPAGTTAYDAALAQTTILAAEIEKNLTAIEVKPLTPLVTVGDPEPQRVKELRDIFESETAKIECSLVRDLDQSLSIVQASLTQARSLDAAKAMEGFRVQLSALSFLLAGGKRTNAVSIATIPASPILQATKDQPFVNSLGMKFVPVPGTKALFCVHETRRQDYKVFADTSADTLVNSSWREVLHQTLQVGHEPDHPVIAISWHDAVGFCRWLSKREGVSYRLPTDREWSFAVGIAENENPNATPAELRFGLKNVYPWGTQWPPPPGIANIADATLEAEKLRNQGTINGYNDNFASTAPVMSFKPNAFGIYDMSGNAWEWCENWYDLKALHKTVRGCCWDNFDQTYLLSCFRLWCDPNRRTDWTGFRVVLEIP